MELRQMKPHILLLTSLLLLLVTSAAAKDDITKELITSKGKTRAYYLYVPPTIKLSSPAPLIVMLHGSGHVGMSLVEKWKDLAKKEGFIIAGPDSLDTRVWGMPQDGPDYLRDLVEELKTKYPINPRRIYLFGHSGGAIFALEMSLMESKYFAFTRGRCRRTAT
jgi:poly(3-hydroxybutyrate) depolymerase